MTARQFPDVTSQYGAPMGRKSYGRPGRSIVTPFLQSYVAAALWSTNDESNEQGGEPMDANYCIDDLADETLFEMAQDCEAFQEQAAGLYTEDEESKAAVDFWLTRNGHGAGFWDGDWPEHGDELDRIAKSFGQCDLYVGDDGKIYA